MAMRINTNIMAINAQRNLSTTNLKLSKIFEKLSSGLRINRAADDAAGLAISEKMRTQIRGLRQGLRNAQDGISLIQTAEGALNEVHALLQRMRELTVQAGSTHLSTDDRTAIGEEMLTLRSEIDNIATRACFNGLALLTGALSVATTSTVADIADTDADADADGERDDRRHAGRGRRHVHDRLAGCRPDPDHKRHERRRADADRDLDGRRRVQVLDFTVLGVKITLTENAGAYANGLTAAEIATDLAGKTVVTTGSGSATFRVGAEVVDNVSVAFSDMRAAALGDGGVNDVADLVVDNQSASTVPKANVLLSAVDTAIGQVSNFRARLGAAQNQMEAAVNSVGVSVENLVSSESRIRDADIAKVSSEMVSRQIMQQAGVAVLAQANSAPQAVLSLLQ